MAVIGGTRLRGTALPAADVAVVRPAAPTTARSTPRVRPVGLLMAGIAAATMLGLVYLTQTLGSNATSSEIRALEAQRLELADDLSRQAIVSGSYTDPEAVVMAAKRHKLRKLDDMVVLPAP
jgi:hypothetical protein